MQKLVKTGNCQLRGSFISDLVLYLEGAQDEDFAKSIAKEILPVIIGNASDIWEVQELFRLLKFFNDTVVLNKNQVNDFVKGIELARDIEDALDMDYNDFWQLAEINKGIVR
jgi:hypothetical protein